MLTRKSGMLALVLGVAMLGAACESKDGDVIIEPPLPVVTLRIAPNPVPTLNVTTPASTFQLVAIVSGNATQTANWTSSAPGVASVNPTTGLVTAVAPGTTTITAVSTVDATARDAVTVTVAGGPVVPPGTGGQPVISIQSVTVGATIVPVNPGAVAGRIVATLNVDIPSGSPARAVRVTLNGVEICRQNFSTSGAISDEVSASAVPVEIQCPINTAALNPDGTPLFVNGIYQGNASIRAEVVDAAGAVLASATFQPVVLANIDFVTANVSTTKGPVIQNGLAWRGGDVTVSLVPTIFSGAGNQPTSLTVSLTTNGNGVIQGLCNTFVENSCGAFTETLTDSNGADGYSVTFSAATPFNAGGAGAGVGGVEDDFVTIGINGLVASGNIFIGNQVILMGGTQVSQEFNQPVGANVLRLDNLAPRVSLLDITPATLACGQSACYVNGAFEFVEDDALATTIDFGVDAQTTTFSAGPSAATLVTVENGGQMTETQVAQTNLLALTTTDALGNSRTVFATDVSSCTSTSSTSITGTLSGVNCGAVTRIQRFGIDLTPPTLSVTGPANNGANDGGVYTFAYIDVGGSSTAGPSGFSANPVSVRVERILASGTACFDSDGAPIATCVFDADEGTVSLPGGVQAYFRTTAFVTDQAGNVSSQIIRITLIDTTAPNVGGIVAPSLIAGGSAATLQASANDNVELGDVKASIGYEGLVTLGFDRRSLADYGPDAFTNSTNIQYTIDQWIWSIETTNASGRPTGMIFDASTAAFDVRDMAGVVDGVACVVDGPNCDVTLQNIDPNVPEQPNSWTALNTTFASGNAAHGNFQQPAPSVANPCNGPTGAACSSSTRPTSTTLSATVTGPNVTFANPFQRVVFYYIDADGRAQVIGTGTASASDNTITATRTWTYTASWSVLGLAPMGYQVFALGIDGSGRALMTNEQTVTVSDT